MIRPLPHEPCCVGGQDTVLEGRAVRDQASTRISGLAQEEEQTCRMLLLLLACNPTNHLFESQQVPQRIVGLLADSGCFEKQSFWTTWMDKWLEDNGCLDDGCPPKSVMLLFQLLSQLIAATPELVSKGNLTKFRPWAFNQLEQFRSLFENAARNPEESGGLMVENGPRTLVASR